VTTLVAGYGSYYQRFSALRIATVGQNLAQLEMENIRSKSKDDLVALCKGDSVGDDDNFPAEAPSSPGYGHDTFYDIGSRDGTFYIRHVAAALGHTPSGAGDVPSGLVLPTGVVDVQPTYNTPSSEPPYWDYTVVLNKEVFPHYTKRVVITDTTPTIGTPVNKVFRIDVTVTWTLGLASKSATVSSEK
jgi:hypothetical protein